MLYGVTMGADGVSQIVSRRLPRDERPPRRRERPRVRPPRGRPAAVVRSSHLGLRQLGRGAARPPAARPQHADLDLLYPAPRLAARRRARARLDRRRRHAGSARSSSRRRSSSCSSSSATSAAGSRVSAADGTTGRTTSSRRTAASPSRRPRPVSLPRSTRPRTAPRTPPSRLRARHTDPRIPSPGAVARRATSGVRHRNESATKAWGE